MTLELPADITAEWVLGDFKTALLNGTEKKAEEMAQSLGADAVKSILHKGTKILKAEPTMVEVRQAGTWCRAGRFLIGLRAVPGPAKRRRCVRIW
jgi:hypothetical protein